MTTIPSSLPAFLGPFRSRPRLLSAIAIGILAGFVLTALPLGIDEASRIPLAWDVGCLWFVVSVLRSFKDSDAVFIRTRAEAQDEGKGFILTLVLVAAVASLVTVAGELSAAKDAHGATKAFDVFVAFGTVALSWFVVQLIFALHYAHEYYAPDGDGDPSTIDLGGLKFPGDEPPDYWDFLHFAVVIGVASQTADIAFTSKLMRRIGTVHGLVAFGFNTIVLAFTINLLAGLL